ncbi:MAG: glyoxalase [Candidatus Saccharibacteria bacterium]|nr:glyoxalase [Candidatus Saccharibacteria bacterium]
MSDTNDLPELVKMDLQLVPVPVSNVDRAIEFYDKIFEDKHDTRISDAMRVVQFTPKGSGCAIVFGTGMGELTDMVPGSVKGLHLVVEDMDKARQSLIARGVDVGEVQDMGGVLYAWFSDPDGNTWALQYWSDHVVSPVSN